MNEYAYEFWDIPNNPAVLRARSEYYSFQNQRNRIADMERLQYLTCNDCVRAGNHKKYRSDQMLHLECKTTRYGKVKRYRVHKCKFHAGKYKPYRGK
jgi:hypothetical protein